MTSNDRLKVNVIHYNTFPEILPLELSHRILHIFTDITYYNCGLERIVGVE